MRHKGMRSATFVSLLAFCALVAPRAAYATPPGANGKIAYSCGITDPVTQEVVYQICSINPDGSGLTQLTFFQPGEGSNHSLAWSPDGTRIAFAAGKNTVAIGLDIPTSNLWVMNADGSGLTQLTSSSTDFQPTWSPDGKMIAFTSFRNDTNLLADNLLTYQVFVMNADGSNQVPITFPSSVSYDWQPSWSPDGSRIAFVHYGFDGIGLSSGYGEIWTVDPTGSVVRQLTVETSIDIEALPKERPSWSPDGTKLAFTALGCCSNSFVFLNPVWIVNADGSNEHPVPADPDLFAEDPAWSPDGTKLVFFCGSETGSVPGALCTSDVDGANFVRLPTGQRIAFPDWGPTVSTHDIVVTNCDDPALAQLTTADSITVHNIAGCTNLDFSQLTNVTHNIDIASDSDIAVNLGNVVAAGGNLSFDVAGSASVNLGNLVTAGGDLTFDTAGSASVNLGNIMSAGGNLTFDSAGSTSVNLGNSMTVGGNLTFDSAGSVTVNLGDGVTVGGDLTMNEAGSVDINASVDGNESITATDGDSVSAQTGGGTTDVSLLGGVAAMHVSLPSGAFTDPVHFSIVRQADSPPVAGTTADGSPVQIDPLASYQFTFAIPTLNKDAQLSFLVNLSLLDADTRAALVSGVQGDSATIFVQGDAPDAAPQAFTRCEPGQTPAIDHCVDAILLDANQQPVAPADAATFAGFTGFTGHFSSYGVALVTPRDMQPPIIAIALSSPNGGVPNGQNGWFIGAPVVGVVSADDRSTGGSRIAAISCGSTTVATSGLETAAATATFAIGGDGETSISCTATDGAGNTTAPVHATVRLDAHGPVLAPTVTPDPVVLHGRASAIPGASDTTSGVAAESCDSPDASTVGPHTVRCSATDSAGNVSTAAAPYGVVYSTSACLGAPAHQVLDPIDPRGASVFKSGRTVPVKFRVCDASGVSIGAPGVVADFRLVGILDGTSVDTISDLPESTASDGAFRWDATAQQWIFNLSTKALRSGATYVYDITLNDGSHIGFRFGVR